MSFDLRVVLYTQHLLYFQHNVLSFTLNYLRFSLIPYRYDIFGVYAKKYFGHVQFENYHCFEKVSCFFCRE